MACHPVRKRRRTECGVHDFDAAAREETQGSTLRLHLLEEYAWGHMSPQQIQKIAALAVSDGRSAALADLAELAQAGSSGRHANNVNRDILRIASNMPKAAMPRRIAMTVQGLEVSSPADVAANEHAYCVSLPHETFASLYHNYPTIWEKTVLPSENHNAKFWSRARHLAQFQEHPIQGETALQKIVPISLHGDETPVTGRGKIWSSSAVIFSWTSLLAGLWSMGTKAAAAHICNFILLYMKPVNMFSFDCKSYSQSPGNNIGLIT